MNKDLIITFLVVLVIACGAYIFINRKNTTTPLPINNTGMVNNTPSTTQTTTTKSTATGGPVSNTTGSVVWKTYTDTTNGVSFQYPDLPINSYYANLWTPPTAVVTPQGGTAIDANGCFPATTDNPHGPIDSTFAANGMNFCVSEGSGQQAGSSITSYSYTTLEKGNYYTLKYTILMPDCGVFEDDSLNGGANYQTCLAGSPYDLDALIKKSASSLKLTK